MPRPLPGAARGVRGRWLAVLLGVVSLAGCSTLQYYGQAVGGQWALLADARPIADVVADPATPPRVRRHLERVPEALAFAAQELALAPTSSYRRYVDLQRDAMVWSVVAAPVDSLQPREWCYPVVGCASYRGYFAQRDAIELAAQLGDAGWDVAVEPVPAYSTLGWFDDPLPSTVIDWPFPRIAGLLFHELAHQTCYVRGDSGLNEAYATVVEYEGVTRWLARHGTPAERAAWRLQVERRQAFLDLLQETRATLEALYAATPERHALLAAKQQVFDRLREDYAVLRGSWGGFGGYDRWFDRPLNNAHLASVATYVGLAPALRTLLQRENDDMRGLHAACRRLGDMAESQRTELLQALGADVGR